MEALVHQRHAFAPSALLFGPVGVFALDRERIAAHLVVVEHGERAFMPCQAVFKRLCAHLRVLP